MKYIEPSLALLAAIFMAGAVCVAGGPARSEQSSASPDFDIAGSVAVSRVSDGDSIRSGALRIRLFGIDAPEMKQQCMTADGAPWACGAAARDALARLVEGEERLRCHLRDVDRYGRLIMQCFAGDTDLAGALVRRGLALAWRRYSDAYTSIEDQARGQRRGLWAGSFAYPWEWRRQQK